VVRTTPVTAEQAILTSNYARVGALIPVAGVALAVYLESYSMSDERETRRFLVSGRVQGVGFRWFVEREAAALGLTGWVRNREDGRVEVMATGAREPLAVLHARLREGPRAARVDEVAVSPAPFLDAKSFGIEGAW
jgi:acylphosphatase